MILVAVLIAAASSPAGLKLLQKGKPAEGVVVFEKALQKSPVNPALANDLGFAYERAGRRAEAERLYRRAIALEPARFYAYGNLAHLLTTAPDRWDRADDVLAFLEQGLARAPPPGLVPLSLRIADFERSVGRTAQARARLGSLRELKLAADDERQVSGLLERIAREERTRAVEDWPEPLPSAEQAETLGRAEEQLAAGGASVALRAVEPLCAALPAWRSARWLRARALESVGRVDEAARDLSVLVQLSPSHAGAWRRLGEILAVHGGILEADRADEALRQALAIEPSWTWLWLSRARVALRRGRPQDAFRYVQRAGTTDDETRRLEQLARAQAQAAASLGTRQAPTQHEPSPEARALYQQAEEWRIAPELEQDDLRRALQLSPGYVDAAAALFSLAHVVPEATLQALHDDGPALLDLAAQVHRAGAPSAFVEPWIDRAIALGAPEALFDRARLRAESGARDGALADLLAYVASAPRPLHLEEARSLRAQLVPARRADPIDVEARLQLADDRPEAALVALGGACAAGLPSSRLLSLGEVHEFEGDPAGAAACYALAAKADPRDAAPLQRLARAAARAPDRELIAPLRLAAARGIADAELALSLLEPARRAAHLDRFLAAAPPDDPFLPEARAARDALLRKSTAEAEVRERRVLALALLGFALAVLAAWIFWAGVSVETALRRAPGLFPALARAVAEVRHDVIKHRASVLGMAAERPAEVARALLEPAPASSVVAHSYERLRAAGRAQGVSLRRLAREKSFGPLVRDLARAEVALRKGALDALPQLDARIRTLHSSRMAALLRLGPRTRLDAGAVASWIHAVEAEVREGGSSWTSPSILLQGMEVEFPVERGALSAIFANLLRNAQAAAGPEGRVIVRLSRERDAAGRDLHLLLVGDSAEGSLSLEAIESRESGRGLAIVRDLTREWHGHLVVRSEEAPWRKAVGACFPAPQA